MAAKYSTLPSGKVFLQILGCGIEDTVPSLFLFTDSKRYLFNCGEGVQRLFTEHKVRVGKLNTVFITQSKWSHLGGFLGMSMTLRDIGKECINISGPNGLQKVIHGARYFLNKENLNFKITEFVEESEEAFQDDEITIKPVVIYPGETKTRPSTGADYQIEIEKPGDICSYSVKPALPNPIISYIGKLRDYPGKLLPNVAIKLGVPKGPMFRHLKDGQSVTLPNGKIITPEQVMEAPIPGACFVIVECPAKKYIPSITNNISLRKCQEGNDSKANLVVHIAGEDVFNDELYQQWVQRFDKDTYHCVLDKRELGKCPPVYCTQFTMQLQLNQVHKDVFPLIEQWRNPYCEESESRDADKESRIYTCKNLSKFVLRPKKSFGLDRSDELKPLNVDSLIQDAIIALSSNESDFFEYDNLLNNDTKVLNKDSERTKNLIVNEDCHRKRHVDESLESGKTDSPARKICKCGLEQIKLQQHFEAKQESKNEINDEDCNCVKERLLKKNVKIRYPKVVCLGTGSSIPSKYRNVSSILIHASPETTLLLDCGEGTFGQIVNHYGREAEEIIKRLQFIFISHLHADHHLGLVRILKLHWKTMSKSDGPYIPPIIAGPRKLSSWLHEYATTCESLRYRFIDCEPLSMKHGTSALTREIAEFLNFTIVPVEHNTEAYGIAMTHKNGWKITYSGDTIPCQSLVAAGKNSTLLIHEATFEDGMEEEAIEKHHSTCGQALDMAEKMNAKNVLLTHFSQRYAKLPVMKNGTPVAVAFDHMEIHPDDIPDVSKLLPKLQLLFPDEDKNK